MNFKNSILDFLLNQGLGNDIAKSLTLIILLSSLIVLAFVLDFISRKVILSFFERLSENSKTKLDDLLVDHKVTKNIAHLVPFAVVTYLLPIVLVDYPSVEKPIETGFDIYLVFILIWIIRSVLKALTAYFRTLPRLKNKPLDSYIQVVMLFVWVIGAATVLVILTGIEVSAFFKTLGAASAVLLLVFKDSILGFVASIQVAINDTVRIGDWVTIPKYQADGSVISISLSTVQVQNFDLTITNVPTYTLVSEGFKNWRGMTDSEGRRIKRSVIIKTTSIKHLNSSDIDRLKKIKLITDYLNNKEVEITKHNSEVDADKSVLINGRNLTNIGVFRKYMKEYIENHSAINKEMTIMIRQLDHTPQGIPLEIYAFSADKVWENYEYIIADIFDHLLASIKYFDLEVFELNFTDK